MNDRKRLKRKAANDLFIGMYIQTPGGSMFKDDPNLLRIMAHGGEWGTAFMEYLLHGTLDEEIKLYGRHGGRVIQKGNNIYIKVKVLGKRWSRKIEIYEQLGISVF